MTSCVPQGSVLAPILFLCYINDLPNQVYSAVRLFADDCLLYRNINTTHDAETLQEDIDKLQTWEADWLMEYNPDTCEIIRITNRRKKKIVTNYSIHEHQLKEVKGAKYLGVTIDRTLSWNEHINNVTKKANNSRAFLQCNINRCPEAIKTLCYQTFVIRPQYDNTAFLRNSRETCVWTNSMCTDLHYSTVSGFLFPRLFNCMRTHRAQTVQPHPDT